MDTDFLSELFRIVEGALKLDVDKVKNYSELLAEKLEKKGETQGAKRIRKILSGEHITLQPAKVNFSEHLPVDPESRIPLVEQVFIDRKVDDFFFSTNLENSINEFITLAKSRSYFEKNDIDSSFNLLLYGPPGCGKSHLAQYIAKQLSLPIFLSRLDGLISSFLGSTAKNLKAIFEFASRRPCILFLDEFDAIAKIRDDSYEVGELKRVVNSFIQSIDAHRGKIILIAATNHDLLLDNAIWRRFDFIINVTYPDFDVREKIWNSYSERFNWSNKQIKVLSDLSEGFSIADIKTVCLRLLQKKHLEKVDPQINESLKILASLSRLSMGIANKPIEDVMKLLIDPSKLQKVLMKRNSELYSISMMAEVMGSSKATVSRHLAKK